MLENKPLLIGLGALAAVAVLALVWRFFPSANNETFPKGLDYLCPNGHEFNKTVAEMNEFFEKHYGEEVPCPQCGAKPCRRAHRDPATGKLRVRDRNEGALPVPGQTAPPAEGELQGRR